MSLKFEPTPVEALEPEEAPLLTTEPGVPVVYASGIADVEIDGPNAVITYYRYRGEGAARVRVPVLEMIRPLVSCETGMIGAIVARKRRKAIAHH